MCVRFPVIYKICSKSEGVRSIKGRECIFINKFRQTKVLKVRSCAALKNSAKKTGDFFIRLNGR